MPAKRFYVPSALRIGFVDLLKRRKDIEYAIFIDGDVGVINPNKLIEHYFTHIPSAELIFYERIFNYEIMAGAFIAK